MAHMWQRMTFTPHSCDLSPELIFLALLPYIHIYVLTFNYSSKGTVRKPYICFLDTYLPKYMFPLYLMTTIHLNCKFLQKKPLICSVIKVLFLTFHQPYRLFRYEMCDQSILIWDIFLMILPKVWFKKAWVI